MAQPVSVLLPPDLRAPLRDVHVTSPFGLRTSPITGKREGHGGIDFRAAEGTPVYAAADGQVTHSYSSKGDPSRGLRSYGERVCIQHAGDWETSYAHLRTRLVRVGQEVRAGDLIGYSGNTGDSTGPHLHFELRHAGVPLDPSPYLTAAAKVA